MCLFFNWIKCRSFFFPLNNQASTVYIIFINLFNKNSTNKVKYHHTVIEHAEIEYMRCQDERKHTKTQEKIMFWL